MPLTLTIINQICTDLGGVAGHKLNIDAINEICTLLGGTGGHKLTIDALNEICQIQGKAHVFKLNIDALNALIAGTVYKDSFTAWSVIQQGTLLKQPQPFLKATVVIPAGGADLSSYCDDPLSFGSLYDSVFWNDDYNAFLTSLGAFDVDWGDGNISTFTYSDGANVGFNHHYAEGTYNLTWKSPHVFLSSQYITDVGDCFALQILDLTSCTLLTAAPNLTGLTALRILALGGCRSLTAAPNLTGLTALQILYLGGCRSLTAAPNLTGLTALRILTLGGCTSLDLTDIDGVLIFYNTLRAAITTVYLQNGVTPTPATELAARTANPQCSFYTS